MSGERLDPLPVGNIPLDQASVGAGREKLASVGSEAQVGDDAVMALGSGAQDAGM